MLSMAGGKCNMSHAAKLCTRSNRRSFSTAVWMQSVTYRSKLEMDVRLVVGRRSSEHLSNDVASVRQINAFSVGRGGRVCINHHKSPTERQQEPPLRHRDNETMVFEGKEDEDEMHATKRTLCHDQTTVWHPCIMGNQCNNTTETRVGCKNDTGKKDHRQGHEEKGAEEHQGADYIDYLSPSEREQLRAWERELEEDWRKNSSKEQGN